MMTPQFKKKIFSFESHLSKHQSCVKNINAFCGSKDLNVTVIITNSDVNLFASNGSHLQCLRLTGRWEWDF